MGLGMLVVEVPIQSPAKHGKYSMPLWRWLVAALVIPFPSADMGRIWTQKIDHITAIKLTVGVGV